MWPERFGGRARRGCCRTAIQVRDNGRRLQAAQCRNTLVEGLLLLDGHSRIVRGLGVLQIMLLALDARAGSTQPFGRGEGEEIGNRRRRGLTS